MSYQTPLGPEPPAARQSSLVRRLALLTRGVKRDRRLSVGLVSATVAALALLMDPPAGVEASAGAAVPASAFEAARATPTDREPASPPARVLGEGAASYYSDALEGRPTASGEVYRGRDLTAAHPSLPFGSRVRVSNLRNGRSVVVRVNDRGPFVARRIIDLSRAAAGELGILRAGHAPVRLEVLD